MQKVYILQIRVLKLNPSHLNLVDLQRMELLLDMIGIRM